MSTTGPPRRPDGGTRPPEPSPGLVEVDGGGAVAVRLPETAQAVERVAGRGRDWLIHRVLLVADVAGLSLAFVLAQLLFQPGSRVHDLIPAPEESLVFVASLPIWIIFGMISGLYGRDHTRTDHSTVDDCVGVFAVVTIGSWISG